MKNQLLLQTKNNYLNTSKSKLLINVYTRNLFNTNKTVILKSIRAVVENQDDEFTTELNTFDDPRYHTFNIYLIASNLIFSSSSRNEILLNTFSIELPLKTQYSLRFHILQAPEKNIFWYMNEYDGLTFFNTYNNQPKYDYQYRFKIVSGLPQYVGKTGTFDLVLPQGLSLFRWSNVLFDDGSVLTNYGYGDLNYPTVIEIAEWYSKFEPEYLDNEYNIEFEVEKYNSEMTTDFTIEYRDLETNKIIEFPDMSNSYPDMNLLFEIV